MGRDTMGKGSAAAANVQVPRPGSPASDSPDPAPPDPAPVLRHRGGGAAACLVQRVQAGLVRRGQPGGPSSSG